MMMQWIKSKFRNHRYVNIGTSSTGGAEYKCLDCKRQLYVPLEWSYMLNIKKIKGCKGTIRRR
ncbi:hypothetical protein MEZE111188_05680 [Mesobacillus zeae]